MVLKTVVWFSFGFGPTCPQLSHYEVISNSDTLELKLYYHISGVWPQVGCERTDTIASVIVADETVLQGVAYSINFNDTIVESTADMQICSHTGIAPVRDDPTLIFPNPFSTELHFQVPYHRNVTLTMHNLLGKITLQQTFTKSATINAGHLAAGVYIYELRDDLGTVENGKVIKQ